jgi:hypothetical protein
MARQLRSRIILALTMDPLEHVLVNLLGATTPDLSYRRFFEEYGITQASELVSITENRLATVSYGVLTPSGGDTPATIVCMFLQPAQQDRILKIVKWFLSKGTDVTNETWFELTPEVLEYWQPASAIVAPATPVGSDARSSFVESAAAKFRKTIKNHSVPYPKFSEDRFWVTWNTNIRIKLRIHGVQLVLDPDYLPETVDETDTFFEMQNFVFGVLTPCARGILHKHVCHDVYQDDIYSGQVPLKVGDGSVSQGEDRVGIVAIMSALLYDPMYTRYDRGRTILGAARVGYTNED